MWSMSARMNWDLWNEASLSPSLFFLSLPLSLSLTPPPSHTHTHTNFLEIYEMKSITSDLSSMTSSLFFSSFQIKWFFLYFSQYHTCAQRNAHWTQSMEQWRSPVCQASSDDIQSCVQKKWNSALSFHMTKISTLHAYPSWKIKTGCQHLMPKKQQILSA